MSTKTTPTNVSPSDGDVIYTYDPVCLIMEDMYGKLDDTVLSDIYDRRHWYIRPWSTEGYKGIKVRGVDSPDARKTVFVGWGQEVDDGILHLETPDDVELAINLKQYFPVLDPDTYTPDTIETASRRFTSFTDKKQYTWQYHPPENLEMQWECVDTEGETIAYWSLKLPGEPVYYSTGCSLTICKGFEGLTLEVVTTCMIVRTFQHRYRDAAKARRALEPPSQGTLNVMTQAQVSLGRDSNPDDSPPTSSSDESGEGDSSANNSKILSHGKDHGAVSDRQ